MENSLPFISIVVPCYNQGQYLSETLQSVLDQSYTSWECIVVDDGSTDDSALIAEKWIKLDSRFKYIHQENNGVSAARNTGIKEAKGEWILPLDGDDKIANNYLSLATDLIISDPTVNIIYCKAAFFGSKNAIWELSEYNYKKFLFSNMIFCSAFYRKEEWERVGGYDENLKSGLEDWEFWINILDETKKVICIDSVCFFYRRRDGSRDANLNENRKLQNEIEYKIYDKHKDKYLKEFNSPQQILLRNLLLEEKTWMLEQKLKKINNNFFVKFFFRLIR